MNFKKCACIIFLIFASFLAGNVEAQSPSIGFVPGNIWYSVDPFTEGDKIKIYTVIFNSYDKELVGTVSFFDENTLLGKKSFVIDPKGVKDVSIDWTVTAGKHNIYGRIEGTKYLVSSDKYTEIVVNQNITEKSERTVKKKLIADPNTRTSLTDDGVVSVSPAGQIDRMGETIVDKTPQFISGPILTSVNAVESIRTSLEESTGAKKIELQNEIKILKEQGSSVEESDGKISTKSNALRPVKSLELFFVKVFHFIFEHMLVFYMLSLAILLYMIRYIIRVFT